MMPFLTLPARPVKLAWKEWLVYLALIVAFVGSVTRLGLFAANGQWRVPTFLDAAALVFLLSAGIFLSRHPYLLKLLFLAIPVKLSLLKSNFRPTRTLPEVHADWVTRFQELSRKEGRTLRVLDISTGTCNSLFRHGWMKLDAEYVGLDLSQTMLLQGLEFMARQHVPVDFVIGDAQALPFEPESFDIVLNYGALNGYADAGLAIREMARVAKPNGLVLVLDEQLYDRATFLERVYFRSVLSSHNVIHSCPVDVFPPELTNVTVEQVYQFYYLCTSVKAAGA
jgi:ubiquinone/menaquinone biosynthesis C-methylase UbiE